MSLARHLAVLRQFLVIAETGSLSRAAQALALSQPTLTKNVQRLEREFGVPLFERRARGVALTSFGEVLLRHAKLIDTECQFAEAEMRAFQRDYGGRLRVGGGPYWGTTLVPTAIARVHERYPKMRIDLEIGVNAVIVPKLFNGDLDIVIGRLPEPAALPPFITVRELGEVRARIVAEPNHPLLRRERVRAADLAPYPWVIYQDDREILEQLVGFLRGRGGEPPRLLVEATSLLAVIQLLKSGPYLGCMPEQLIEAQPGFGLRPLPMGKEVWKFRSAALYPRFLEQVPPVQMLIEGVDAARRGMRS